MALLDLIGQLSGEIPSLSPLLASKFLQQAWADIRQKRLWGFLVADAAVVCPVQIAAGRFAITQFANTVTADATASAALPSTLSPDLTLRQIRFMGAGTTSQIYNIREVDRTAPAAIVLTLDRVVQEPTAAASLYLVYRCYVTPPDPDFLRFESLVDMQNGYRITREKLTYTSTYFDLRDPQRQAFGLAYMAGFYRGAASDDPNVNAGSPIYELWPGPTQGQSFYCRYRKRGEDLASLDAVQAPAILDQLIIQRAKGWYVIPWIETNRGLFPTFKSVNTSMLLADAKKSFAEMLIDTKRMDNEQDLQDVMNRGHTLRGGANSAGGFPMPIDAAFMQRHAVIW